MHRFRLGDRVIIRSHPEWPNGTTGTISSPVRFEDEEQPLHADEGNYRVTPGRHGDLIFFFVRFDEAIDDGSVHGPYSGDEIEDYYLEPFVQFLPSEPGARLLLGCLALPCFLFSILSLLYLLVNMTWPPAGITDTLMLFAGVQLFGAACVVTFLALVWALATPRWVAGLLQYSSRRLIAITGAFLIEMGLVGIIMAAVGKKPIGLIVFALCFVTGVGILVHTFRDSQAVQRSSG